METPKPQVYVSVLGGIAEAMTTRGDVEIILIDWDNYNDNLPDPDTVLWHIELAQHLDANYSSIWFDLHEALMKAAGDELEQYDEDDRATITEALEEAGHPLPKCQVCGKTQTEHYCQNIENHPEPNPCAAGEGKHHSHQGHQYEATAS